MLVYQRVSGWWFSALPLWKMMEWVRQWVRQLGWWHSQYMYIYRKIKHVPNHQPSCFRVIANRKIHQTPHLVENPQDWTKKQKPVHLTTFFQQGMTPRLCPASKPEFLNMKILFISPAPEDKMVLIVPGRSAAAKIALSSQKKTLHRWHEVEYIALPSKISENIS